MAGILDFTWEQGEDLDISLIYKISSDPEEEAIGVNLTGYTVKMNITSSTGATYVVNTNDSVPATLDEVTVGSLGEINITVPRSVILPGGDLYASITGVDAVTEFTYDLFLKSPANKYERVIKGKIYVDKSVTTW